MFYQELWRKSTPPHPPTLPRPRLSINISYSKKGRQEPRPKSAPRITTPSLKQFNAPKLHVFDPLSPQHGDASPCHATATVQSPRKYSANKPATVQSPRKYSANKPRSRNPPIFVGNNPAKPRLKIPPPTTINWKRPISEHRRSNKSNRTPLIPPKQRKDTTFDLLQLKQYHLQGLKKITLQPPSSAERKHNFFHFNKGDGTWTTTLFPHKIPKGNSHAIETWLNMTTAEYFNMRLPRSTAKAVADVRFFHLAAANAVADLLQKKGSKCSEMGGVLKNFLGRLLKLDADELLSSGDDVDDVGGGSSGGGGGGGSSSGGGGGNAVDVDDAESEIQFSRSELNDIIKTQSQIIFDLHESLEFEKAENERIKSNVASMKLKGR